MDAADGWSRWVPGTRVVVRRRRPAPVPAGEPPLTDVLGEVLHADDDGVVVRTRRGDVHVPAADVLRAKVVPPAPPRRSPRPGPGPGPGPGPDD